MRAGGGRVKNTIEFSCDAGGDLFRSEVLFEGTRANDTSSSDDTLATCAGLSKLVVQALDHVVDDIEIGLVASRGGQSAHHAWHGSGAVCAVCVRHSLRWRGGLAGSLG